MFERVYQEKRVFVRTFRCKYLPECSNEKWASPECLASGSDIYSVSTKYRTDELPLHRETNKPQLAVVDTPSVRRLRETFEDSCKKCSNLRVMYQQREQHRPRQEAQLGHKVQAYEQPVDPALAEAALTQPVAADRLAHGDARAAQNRHERYQQRHQQPGRHLERQHHGWDADGGDIEVEGAREEARERPGAEYAQWHGHKQRQQAERQHRNEIHPDDIAAARADRFHHADLAGLLGQQRAYGVDHEEAAQQHGEEGDDS